MLARQQTLRALIDWSYDLLSPTEQRLFQRLSVFAGGWTLEAAETIVASSPIESGDVMDLLANLVEKSLVLLDLDSGRYRMLDTVQHYAAERLAAGDDDATTRSRHLTWCLALAERARAGLAGPEQGRWIAELDRERENLLGAHRWCDRAEDGIEQGLHLVFLLKLYWYQHGLLTLGHRVTAEALARTRADDRSLARCRGLADVGQFCTFMGRYAEARGYLEDRRGSGPAEIVRPGCRWSVRRALPRRAGAGVGGGARARVGRRRARCAASTWSTCRSVRT